jgi:hypothetical protein
LHPKIPNDFLEDKNYFSSNEQHTAQARQRYEEYLDRVPWGEHAQEALERFVEK